MKNIIKKVKCIYSVGSDERFVLTANKADIPKAGGIYTIKKAFFHVGYSYKTSGYIFHFEEISHGYLVGYSAKYFIPVDEDGNPISKDTAQIELSPEEKPQFKIQDNMILSTSPEIDIVEINESHRDYVTSIIRNRWNVSAEESNDEFNRWLRNDRDSICYVCLHENSPVATAVFDTVREEILDISPYNTLLWVEPEFRGNNIGRILTEKRFEWALSKGYKIIYLDTLDAMEYHKKQGWTYLRSVKHNDKEYSIMFYILDHELSFEVSRDIRDFVQILKPFSEDFGPIFYQTILVWTKIISSDNAQNDKLWDVWIVKLGRKPIGICGLYTLQGAVDTSELWLGWFGIVPELRNLGLGKNVMQHLYKYAKKFGCKRIFSYVDKEGAPLNFYKREGFEVIGTVEEYCKSKGLSNIDGEDFEDKNDWVIRKEI